MRMGVMFGLFAAACAPPRDDCALPGREICDHSADTIMDVEVVELRTDDLVDVTVINTSEPRLEGVEIDQLFLIPAHPELDEVDMRALVWLFSATDIEDVLRAAPDGRLRLPGGIDTSTESAVSAYGSADCYAEIRDGDDPPKYGTCGN